MVRPITFLEMHKMICDRLPEADPHQVMNYLLKHVGIENGIPFVGICVRRIEQMLIDEGSI